MARVIIYSPNRISKSMAGAAIRAWEFAKTLAEHHQVILISPEKTECQPQGFDCISSQDDSVKKHFKDADVLIAQRLTVPLTLSASSHGTKIIIDAYAPSPLELLEYDKMKRLAERYQKITSEISTLAFSFKMADGILCASEKQRQLWLGFLLSKKLITPSLYDKGQSLRHFLDVVPFGLSSTPPHKNGRGLKEMLGLRPEDKVILWGGGIWNWFDPLTLIKAMKRISLTRSDIKLVFMGVKPPDPSLPIMKMAFDAMQLARDLNIIDRCVYFHHEWIPYEERQNFLLEADIGASTHFDHLETQFSFRTRILDYLWAQLPIIATEGDCFAEMIEDHQLGRVVPYQNESALVEAILDLLSDQKKLLQIKERMKNIREQFYWASAVAPLNQMIQRLVVHPQQRSQWQTKKALLNFVWNKIGEKGLMTCLRKGFQQCRDSV